MSVVIAVRSQGRTHLAADTAFLRGQLRGPTTGSKIVTFGSNAFAIGATGSVVILDVLETHASMILNAFELGERRDAGARAVGQVIQERLHARVPGTTVEVGLVLAAPTGLWILDQHFSPVSYDDGVPVAVGSGEDVALGAFLAARWYDPTAGEKSWLHLAVSAAMATHVTVGGYVEYWTHYLSSTVLEPLRVPLTSDLAASRNA